MATAYHLEALRKHRILERQLEAKQRLAEKEAEEKGTHHHHHHHRHHHHHHHCSKRSRPKSAQTPEIEAKKERPSNSSHLTPLQGAEEELVSTTATPSAGKSPVPSVFSGQTTTPSSRMSTASIQPPSSSHHLEAASRQSRNSTAGSVSRTESHAESYVSDNASHVSSQQQLEANTSSKNTPRSHTLHKEAAAFSSRSNSSCRSHTVVSNKSRGTTSAASTGGTSYCTSCTCTGSRCSECLRLGSAYSHSSSILSRTSTTCSEAERRAERVKKDLHKQEMCLRDSNLVMGPVLLDDEIRIQKIQEKQNAA